MKESNFYSDEFEQLIREKTEQYKMYPSENVWKGVHNSLHTKRRWFIGSMAFLVTGILFFSGKELLAPSHPSTHKLAAAGLAPDSPNTDPARSSQPDENPHANFVRLRPINTATNSGRHLNAIAGNNGGETEETDQPLNHLAITISHPVVSQPDLSELLSHAVQLPGEAPSLIGASGSLDSWLVRSGSDNAATRKTTDAQGLRNNAETGREPAETYRETAEAMGSKESGRDFEADDATVRGVIENLSARGQQRTHTGQISRDPSTHQGSVAGKIKESDGMVKASADAIGEAADLMRVTWLHDYAEYSLAPNPRGGRLFFQLFLAPTINYRNFSGGNMPASKELNGGSFRSTGDMLGFIKQGPTLGFEFGANVLYRVTRNLTVKGGLQFNYLRFNMVAYSSPQQQTASYQTPFGNHLYMDSVIQAAPASNNNPGATTFSQSTLYDDYYQLSVPVGFELRVLGNERLQFNLGATIQPGYLFNTNSYVLSSDYTSYSKQPSAFRRWNLSGGIEAFLSYQSGPIRWQIGPEFRYQLFANYLNGTPAPVSENLKGVGIKIGITKPLP